MAEYNSEQNQSQKILDLYSTKGYLDKETKEGILRFKEKIEVKNHPKILSSRLLVAKLKDQSLDEREEKIVASFEELIRSGSDKELLNEEQLKCFEDIRFLEEKYFYKDTD